MTSVICDLLFPSIVTHIFAFRCGTNDIGMHVGSAVVHISSMSIHTDSACMHICSMDIIIDMCIHTDSVIAHIQCNSIDIG